MHDWTLSQHATACHLLSLSNTYTQQHVPLEVLTDVCVCVSVGTCVYVYVYVGRYVSLFMSNWEWRYKLPQN